MPSISRFHWFREHARNNLSSATFAAISFSSRQLLGSLIISLRRWILGWKAGFLFRHINPPLPECNVLWGWCILSTTMTFSCRDISECSFNGYSGWKPTFTITTSNRTNSAVNQLWLFRYPAMRQIPRSIESSRALNAIPKFAQDPPKRHINPYHEANFMYLKLHVNTTLVMAEKPDETHCRTSSHTPNDDHLYSSVTAFSNVLSSLPPDHDACLHISE